ncbi:MAG: YdjY domain-containing protein [Verrucomicrobiota bacterium]
MLSRTVLCLLTCLAGNALVGGPMPLGNPSANSMAVLTNSRVRQVGPGTYQVGIVKLEKAKNTITFPAQINMREGIVEYALVSSQGKLHESVLQTEAEPYHIHVAMLLLGAKGSPKELREEDFLRNIPGDKVTIQVAWKVDGVEKNAPLESWILDKILEKPMKAGEWTYNGSRTVEAVFLAQRERSIIALIADPDALVNNPRTYREKDDNWTGNPEACPPVGTPVQVSIKIQPQKPLPSP